jgi:hypothetical protein
MEIMNTLLTDLTVISGVAAAITTLFTLLFRLVWRRGKTLQEP